jgi:hypothetical protein
MLLCGISDAVFRSYPSEYEHFYLSAVITDDNFEFAAGHNGECSILRTWYISPWDSSASTALGRCFDNKCSSTVSPLSKSSVSNISREIMTSGVSRPPSTLIAPTRVDLVESLLTGAENFASGKSTGNFAFIHITFLY